MKLNNLKLKLEFNDVITIYRYESIVLLIYTNINFSKSAIDLILTWMVRFSVSTNDRILISFDV